MTTNHTTNTISVVVWPATVILLAVIAAPMVLVLTGHSAEVHASALVIGQGVGFLAQLWVIHASRKPTEEQLSEVQDALTHPGIEDVGSQVTRLAGQISALSGKVDNATGSPS